MFQSFFVPFFTILLAELGDKSQLSLLLLSSRTKHHLQLIIGAILGFLLVDGAAILAGAFIRNIIPDQILTLLAAGLFIFFGILSFRDNPDDEKQVHGTNALFMGFTAIGLTEWGDKTQLASAAFAAEHNPVLVFFGVMTALTILSITAIMIGKLLLKKINRSLLTKISGIVFILIGISILLF
jgi:Ca2+/H+ antiporter, TMEM165/GDT1 family